MARYFLILFFLLTCAYSNGQEISIAKNEKLVDTVSQSDSLFIIESFFVTNRQFVYKGESNKCGLYNKNLINFLNDNPNAQSYIIKGAKIDKLSIIPFILGGACAISYSLISDDSKANSLISFGFFGVGFTISNRMKNKSKGFEKIGIKIFNKKVP